MINDYLEQKRRHRVRKELRRTKPYLMGDALEQEIDKVIGVVDSGKMDWATLVEDSKTTSQYPTPESVIPKIYEVAEKFSIKSWVIYWFFKKKVLKLQSSGRTKTDYLALLQETATKCKPMNQSEKAQALVLFSNEVRKTPLSIEEALRSIITKGI